RLVVDRAHRRPANSRADRADPLSAVDDRIDGVRPGARAAASIVGLGARVLPERAGAKLEELAHSFAEGLGILKRRQDMIGVGLTSILAWLLEASMYLLIAQSFGLDLSPAAVLLVTAVANLATLIPSSPGYVGPFETGVLLVLNGALGIPRALALSYAIVVHAALYFPATILGLIYWLARELLLAGGTEDGRGNRPWWIATLCGRLCWGSFRV
ncbi:MAG: lysylphosphatidylglycerol synthase transmembrane domain-containing protein, partial [Thermomicrobiales bacterium]